MIDINGGGGMPGISVANGYNNMQQQANQFRGG
jgi:hypothetical protein